MSAPGDDIRARFLQWRGVEDPCLKCDGAGIRLYSSTATWRGGIGGAMMTNDVCDSCWGTGDRYRTGTDLRRMRAEEERRVAERAVDLLAQRAGATLSTARADVIVIVTALRALGGKRGTPFQVEALCESLANTLELAATGKERT